MEPDVDDALLSVLPDADKGSIQSIDRAAAVLALLDQDTRTLTPGIVAERLGLNRTTAHRYLQSLQSSGFLDADYGLGPLFDQLSALISGRQQLLTVAPGIMRQLSDATGSTCVLSMLGRTGAVVTLVEEASSGTIILTVKVGTNLEVRAAQSRVLLAFQSDPGVVTRVHAGLTAPRPRPRPRSSRACAGSGSRGATSAASASPPSPLPCSAPTTSRRRSPCSARAPCSPATSRAPRRCASCGSPPTS